MYPYDLGWHIKAQRLCRIPKGEIPSGTVRIKKYRESIKPMIGKWTSWKNPYERDGELSPQYWSIHRAQDLDRMSK